MRTIEEFIHEQELDLRYLESIEDYERCCYIRDVVNAIKAEDELAYIELVIPIKELTKSGFFPEGASLGEMKDRLLAFFGYQSIFNYSLNSKDIAYHLSEG